MAQQKIFNSSALHFYIGTDADIQAEHVKEYAFKHIYPVIMPNNTIYPFQFFIPNAEGLFGTEAQLNNAYLHVIDSVTHKRVESIIITNKLYGINFGYDTTLKCLWVQCLGLFPVIDNAITEGYYQLHLEIGTGPYITAYSDVFTFTNKNDQYLELEYWNPEADFQLSNGLITFANNFHFKILLATELGKPEYEYEEEKTSRLGYDFLESQVSKKIYKFTTIANEATCDALRLVRLCSNKYIRSLNEEYNAINFEMDVDWQEQGDLAAVICQFNVDDVIVNLGGYKYVNKGGDYNDDYNTDYKNS